MPELRKDPIVDRWVIIADNRGKRPQDYALAPQRSSGRLCPFCEGNESETPGEVAAVRDPSSPRNGPGWKVRVVPNKYPAVLPDQGDPVGDGGVAWCDAQPGRGIHEVIIESPRHVTSLTQLSLEEICLVLRIYRQRFRELALRGDVSSTMLFKNMGAAAGASLEHIHSQLIALPTIPTLLAAELNGAAAYHEKWEACIFCDMRSWEQRLPRQVLLTERYTAWCPFASRFAYETWILPNRHASHWESISDEEIVDLASVLKRVLSAVEQAVRPPAYNVVFHSAPLTSPALPHYHWHIEVLPALARAAGFEWGSGYHINPVYPEQAARELRETLQNPHQNEVKAIRQTEAKGERLPMP